MRGRIVKRERQRAPGYMIARCVRLLAWAAMAGGGVRQRYPRCSSDWLQMRCFGGDNVEEGPRIAWKAEWKRRSGGAGQRILGRAGRAGGILSYTMTRS